MVEFAKERFAAVRIREKFGRGFFVKERKAWKVSVEYQRVVGHRIGGTVIEYVAQLSCCGQFQNVNCRLKRRDVPIEQSARETGCPLRVVTYKEIELEPIDTAASNRQYLSRVLSGEQRPLDRIGRMKAPGWRWCENLAAIRCDSD